MELSALRVGVIGASLGGLSVAALLSRAGAQVTLLERAAHGFAQRGGGLGVSLSLVRALTNAEPPHLVHSRRLLWLMGEAREAPTHIVSTSYGALWQHLYGALASGILRHEQQVTGAQLGPMTARVVTARERFEFELVVAADGGDSALRALVDPEHHARCYAGYVLWRGLVPASALEASPHGFLRRFSLANNGEAHLVAYAIPSLRGETEAARRWLNWGCYVSLDEARVREHRAQLGSVAAHVMERSAGALAMFQEDVARQRAAWPSWVRELFEATLGEGALSPHPVYQYVPHRLTRGRLVLLGDAGHLASPITGAGGRMAMEDALVLCEALVSSGGLEEALSRYERRRLPEVSAVVSQGQRWSPRG